MAPTRPTPSPPPDKDAAAVLDAPSHDRRIVDTPAKQEQSGSSTEEPDRKEAQAESQAPDADPRDQNSEGRPNNKNENSRTAVTPAGSLVPHHGSQFGSESGRTAASGTTERLSKRFKPDAMAKGTIDSQSPTWRPGDGPRDASRLVPVLGSVDWASSVRASTVLQAQRYPASASLDDDNASVRSLDLRPPDKNAKTQAPPAAREKTQGSQDVEAVAEPTARPNQGGGAEKRKADEE